jgi:hypothetical protein
MRKRRRSRLPHREKRLFHCQMTAAGSRGQFNNIDVKLNMHVEQSVGTEIQALRVGRYPGSEPRARYLYHNELEIS